MALPKKKFSLKGLQGISRFFKFIVKNASINVFLVLTLIVFAFFLGLLTNKVIYLEQQVKNTTVAAAAGAQNPQAAAPTPPPVVDNLSEGQLPILGNKDAKVTMIEFSDFQCPFCKSYFDTTAAQINDKYIKTGKVKFAYRYFPLTSIHPNAQKSAEAAACANDQGQFWAYHDVLFKNQDTWGPKAAADAANDFIAYAGQVGLNTDQFQSCLSNSNDADKINSDVTDATAAQVDATPTFFINGVRVTGAVPFAQLQQVIEEQLKK